MAAAYLLPVSVFDYNFWTIWARIFKFCITVGTNERNGLVLSKMRKFIFQDGGRVSTSGFVFLA